MSRHYGTLFQQAHVVRDLDAAIAWWTGHGVGPFFRLPAPLPFVELRLRGRPTTADIYGRVVLAQAGPIQIELIEPTSEPSPFVDFLAATGGGFQHLGFISDDYDAQIAAAEGRGLVRAIQGERIGSRMCYMADPARPAAPMIELVELQPERRATFEMIRAASVGWDGRDPVRNV